MTLFPEYGGESAALAGAFLWAFASVIYGRLGQRLHPLELNLVKGILALAMLAVTLLLVGDRPSAVEPLALGLLLLSGAIGVGWGDTMFFRAMSYVGARRTLLLGLLAPPMAALLAWALLGEALAPGAWLGILGTVAGVAWVVSEREPVSSGEISHLGRGVGFGLLAALAGSTGAVLSRAALTQTQVTPLWASTIRLMAGLFVTLVWFAAARRPIARWLRSGSSQGLWPRLLLAVFTGTYLAIWLQQIALKLAPAGVVQTLLSTSPLWILPLAAWTGERVTARAIAGVVVALLGIALLFILG